MSGDWLQQFVDDGTISADQLAEAERMAANLGIPIEDALVRNEYVDAQRMAAAKAEHFGFDFIDLNDIDISPSLVELVPESVARENIVIPVAEGAPESRGGRSDGLCCRRKAEVHPQP
ncbi:MAG: hypothetical protein KDA52_24200 [Planctomycetaceae bacterium]|nr:hypothetical protein [Planctomycetaceae bacterium]